MKTPEEIKRGLELCSHEGHGEEIICEHCPYDSNSCAVLICTRRLSADALAYIQQLEAKVPRWISVEERLPEQGQFVAFIPTCNQGSVYVGILSHVGKMGGVVFTHKEGRCKSNYYAKHWMPLPEPPKEDDHEDNLHG